MVKELTEKEFNEVIKEGNVLIDCYADWCGPCRMLSPIIDEVSNEIDNYSFYKLNIDNAENIAREYQIFSIPTLLIFKESKLEKKSVGLISKEDLVNLLK